MARLLLRLPRRLPLLPMLLAVIVLSGLCGCGYHVAGQANLLPKDIRTIAITPWNNASTQYKLSGYMTEAMSREMISRTRFTVNADPSKADATLTASIVNMFSNATVSDPATGRGTGAQVIVQIQVRLVAKDGRILFDRPNLDFRERYEISTDPRQYLDESQAALQRLSRNVARTLVSAILENF